MRMMRTLLACLLLISFLLVPGVWAIWKLYDPPAPVSQDISVDVTDFLYPPNAVYITDIKQVSGSGSASKLSYVYSSILRSTVSVPRGTELTFDITVLNNSSVEQGYDGTVVIYGSDGSGYDNEGILYEISNIKRPTTMDGEMESDVTRIPPQGTYTYRIKFKNKSSNNTTLNSVLHFIFKPFDQISPDHFTAPVEGALDQFKKILNTPESLKRLMDIMDQSSSSGAYVGNVVGSSTNDTAVLKDLFEGQLNLMLIDPDTQKLTKTDLTCMIKEQDLDGDGVAEMTLYMTPDDLSKKTGLFVDRTIDNVYVAVFKKVGKDADGKDVWDQYGELYHGTSECNNYEGSSIIISKPSILTDDWRSSQVYHGVKKNSTIQSVIEGYKATQK